MTSTDGNLYDHARTQCISSQGALLLTFLPYYVFLLCIFFFFPFYVTYPYLLAKCKLLFYFYILEGGFRV